MSDEQPIVHEPVIIEPEKEPEPERAPEDLRIPPYVQTMNVKPNARTVINVQRDRRVIE